MVDCIIIGTGPAGLSAALNLKTYNKSTIWFGSKSLSAKVLKAEKVVNYPGMPSVSGAELFEAFNAHVHAAGLEITEKTVTMIGSLGNGFMVLADNEMFEAKSLILAMGVVSAKLLENEERLLGRGVSYCATCDGMLYKGKNFAVLTNDPKYEHHVQYLADLAAEVHIFPAYKEPGVTGTNITQSLDLPVAVNGENRVESLTLRSGEVLPVDGVFCLRNAIAPATLMPGLAVADGHITVDRSMATNIPGCYAAGDCTGRPYQYTKAVGEGNVAAHSVIEYLAEK